MSGTKRPADSGVTTRASKIAKTDTSATPSKAKKGAKKGVKPAIPTAKFKATALPLHVNVTHTPPTIADADTEAVSVATVDPGFVGNLTLVPSSFSTGSYGWKGSKRITVELQNGEGGSEREKVQVMLTINATVLGSKQAKPDQEDEANGEVDESKDEDPVEASPGDDPEQPEE
ncbi:hypothetical protein BDZ94DRAFT_203569 [Collybia nuda]|uniref:Uncharacterized protein n=1 Tax=Collybia nuda TaxID=64659 RepID=A0A9P6CN09_9AGAR|nr:hypothetical protein BDZ94DRAFT_203569 [Collybia nuda]